MKSRIPSSSLVLAIAATIAFVLLGARGAAAIDNGSELKCQIGSSQSIGKFLRDKGKCIDNCYKKAFADGVAPACTPPYTGALLGCVTSAEGKAGGEMQSNCAQDCPECYTGGDCPADAAAKVADAESHVETLTAGAYCDDSASPDALTLAEFKCQRTVQKVLTHFAATKLKCFAKCRKGEIGGKLPAGSCDQPTTDLKTQECIARAEDKTAFLIDKKCDAAVNPSADKPECAPYDTRAGADWVAVEEAYVDASLPALFCNDPSPTTTTTSTTTTTTTMP